MDAYDNVDAALFDYYLDKTVLFDDYLVGVGLSGGKRALERYAELESWYRGFLSRDYADRHTDENQCPNPAHKRSLFLSVLMPEVDGLKTPQPGKEFPEGGTLFTEGVAAKEVFAQVDDRLVQGLAGVARFETELARSF